jgi:hypothetical protein
MLDNRLKFRAGKIARSHLPTYHRLTDNGRIILVLLVVDEKHLETGFGGQRCASLMTPDVYFGAVVKGPDTLMVPSGIGPHAQPRAVNALPHIVGVCPINGLLDDERIMFHSFLPFLLCRLAARERLDAARTPMAALAPHVTRTWLARKKMPSLLVLPQPSARITRLCLSARSLRRGADARFLKRRVLS